MEKYPGLRMFHFVLLVSRKGSSVTCHLRWSQVWVASLCPPQTGLCFPVFGLQCAGPWMPKGNGTHCVTHGCPLQESISDKPGKLPAVSRPLLIPELFRDCTPGSTAPVSHGPSREGPQGHTGTPRSPWGRRPARLLRSVRCRSPWAAQGSS